MILTGAGRGFCAGLDLAGFGDPPHSAHLGPTQRGFATQRLIANLIPHMRSLPQPVIAAVNGPAAGGGFALVLGSDIRIAARTARFNAAFIRIGLSACDIGTSWLLPRLVGVARAQELMLTGRIFDAEEAYRIGLVVDLVDDDALLDAALAKADEVMLNSPFGVALTKEGMWSALEIPGMQAAIDLENRQQIMASATSDHREAMKAFLERRPPPTPTPETRGPDIGRMSDERLRPLIRCRRRRSSLTASAPDRSERGGQAERRGEAPAAPAAARHRRASGVFGANEATRTRSVRGRPRRRAG